MLIFGLYGIVIFYYGKLKKDKEQETTEFGEKVIFEPHVSIVVPTHNEEIIISKKIENLLNLNYPKEKLEFIFVDDSSDSTPDIIRGYSKRFPNIHLIRFHERMGYSPSMIAGCKASKSEIVVLNDAGSFLDAEALSALIHHFQNPKIGLVTGRCVILNLNEEVGRSENLYQKIFNFLRVAETRMDSTFFIKGEAAAVRKDLIKDLEECSETFDTTVGLYVRKKGYKAIYNPNVKFYEYAPSTRSGRIKQKTIRGANLVKVLFKFRHIMLKRKYGRYGCLILPMNFAMLTIVPLTIFAAFVFLVMLTFLDFVFSLIFWIVLGFVFLSLLIFARHLVFTFLEFEYSLLKAIYQMVFTKRTHDKIEKVNSTRR